MTALSATTDEKARLLETFLRYCAIESPSFHERPMVDAVASDLRELGIEVVEDDSGSQTGSDSGNLFARIEGPPDSRSIVFCAHLDTVPLDAPVDPVVRGEEERWVENANQAILGADNKAAVAVMMEVARRAVREGAPVGIELVFTTTEEVSLRGAKAFDLARLESEFGFVFDHATPIGEVIVAAPTYYRIDASFHGQAAHAGIRPEDGRNAITAAAAGIAALELGRIDPQTTANVGLITGGTAGNVVAERCDVMLECRSLDNDRAAATASAIVDGLTHAAGDYECDLETDVDEQFRGYRLSRGSDPVVAAASALESLGLEPEYVTTGGGSDANAFIVGGFPCLNLANGTEANHQPDERVSVRALETMLDVALNLVRTSAN